MDDSHARFDNIDQAKSFQKILNEQDAHIKYTIETENSTISLQFLDLNITNDNGQYVYKIYRKNAITNVQLKTNSGHDPKILKGIFTGFLHRAYTVCSQQHQQEEIDFLISNFVDNGYERHMLDKITKEYHRKRDSLSTQNDNQPTKNEENQNIVVLPWVPGLSPKLRKTFRSAGYKTVFKSSTNLMNILTSRNKSKLPDLSQPGVYITSCGCGKKYVGETSLKTSTRIEQHKKSINDEKWDLTGISDHAKNCKVGLEWKDTTILKIEGKKFDRKVREALEIQLQQTSPQLSWPKSG